MVTTQDVLRGIAESETISFLRELVRTRSYNPPGEEAAVGELVAHRLQASGLKVTTQAVQGDRANVVGRLRGQGREPALLLCAHLDTVPPGDAAWAHDPLGADLVNGRVYGRGAADTKGSLAAMIVAAGALQTVGVSLRGDLVVLATADEEDGGEGAHVFKAQGGMDEIGHVVIGEPTGLDLAVAHRGLLWLEITAHGQAAHGAMPDRGVNAILPMAAILDRLADHQFPSAHHPLLRPSTVNVGTIQGGRKTNIVPDRCQATIDIRTLPGQTHQGILGEVRRLVADESENWPGLEVEVRVANEKLPVATAPDVALVDHALAAAQDIWGSVSEPRGLTFATDGSVLSNEPAVPSLICGPGDESMAHQTDEYVEVDQVLEAARFYGALAVRLLT